eukprot:3012882-Ditylum_brightwellii.AAC.1
MDKDGMACIYRVCVGWCVLTSSTEEFTTHETAVDVWTRLKGDGTGMFKVKIEEGTVYCVEVGACLGVTV